MKVCWLGLKGSSWMCDGKVDPIAVVLTPKDRENIARMPPEATVYAVIPDEVMAASRVGVDAWLDMLAAKAGE